MRHFVTATLGLVALGHASFAGAQTFPTVFAPLHCQRGVMIDAYRDQSGALDERDLVGTVVSPAGFHAVDAQFLYLRMRLDASPLQGLVLRPFGWGFEISTDSNSANYEILISVDGSAGAVDLFRNNTTTIANSPADPADQQIATYPFAQNGRVVDAGSSLFGGGNDSFLDLAVPWSDLAPLGLTPASLVTIWAGSSSMADRLDGDLACHNAGGNTLLPRLSDNPPAPVAPDPARGPGPVGGPSGNGSGDAAASGNQLGGSGIEGGPGCDCATDGTPRAPGAPWGGAWLIIGAIAAAARRRAPKRGAAGAWVAHWFVPRQCPQDGLSLASSTAAKSSSKTCVIIARARR
jgi:MYXO-CTERM domain-containing protein